MRHNNLTHSAIVRVSQQANLNQSLTFLATLNLQVKALQHLYQQANQLQLQSVQATTQVAVQVQQVQALAQVVYQIQELQAIQLHTVCL